MRSTFFGPSGSASLRWMPKKLSETGVVQKARLAEMMPLMSTTLGTRELSLTSRTEGSAERENWAAMKTGAS